MAVEANQAQAMDPGLFALTVLLQLRGVDAEADQVRDHCGPSKVGIPEILGCAKRFGLDAQIRIASWEELAGSKLPAIASLRGGNLVLITAVGEDKVILAKSRLKRAGRG